MKCPELHRKVIMPTSQHHIAGGGGLFPKRGFLGRKVLCKAPGDLVKHPSKGLHEASKQRLHEAPK